MGTYCVMLGVGIYWMALGIDKATKRIFSWHIATGFVSVCLSIWFLHVGLGSIDPFNVLLPPGRIRIPEPWRCLFRIPRPKG